MSKPSDQLDTELAQFEHELECLKSGLDGIQKAIYEGFTGMLQQIWELKNDVERLEGKFVRLQGLISDELGDE